MINDRRAAAIAAAAAAASQQCYASAVEMLTRMFQPLRGEPTSSGYTDPSICSPSLLRLSIDHHDRQLPNQGLLTPLYVDTQLASSVPVSSQPVSSDCHVSLFSYIAFFIIWGESSE